MKKWYYLLYIPQNIVIILCNNEWNSDSKFGSQTPE